MKLPEGLPLPAVTAQVAPVTMPPVIVQAASVNEKSEPVTVTVVPAGPEVGLSTIAGGSTVKIDVATSAPGLPVTVIV